MSKADTTYIDALTSALQKARMKMSDEYDPNEDPYDTESEDDRTDRNFDPDEEESTSDDWLKENDPEHLKAQDEKNRDGYEEYSDSEDEDAHQKGINEDIGDDDSKDSSEAVSDVPMSRQAQPSEGMSEQPVKRSRFEQPSREDLNAMRTYTRPWEQRARETQALNADPSKNPELARHGNIVEARNTAHGDRNSAYRQLTNSNDYKNADPITQMEMDDNFEKDWKTKNPEHLKNALQSHHEAHKKGEGNRDLHAAGKDAAIRNIIGGGAANGEGYSLEEGMQHAGGTKGEEGGTQATIKQDPTASFAMGNQDFIKQYAKDYANKGKKVGNIDDMMSHDAGSKRDIARILGEGPSKDPKFEKFFAHYYPLIGMNAKRTLDRLGLDPKHPDIDMSMLHEAGMHGLIQAMNDYNHDNPGKASFVTHAANKIRGLQMTAMRNQDQIPAEVRQAQKQYTSQNRGQKPVATPTPVAQAIPSPQEKPKVDLHNVIGASTHPKASDMQDRLKRVTSQRASQRRPANAALPSATPTPQIQESEEE